MNQYYMRIIYGIREAEDDFVTFYCPGYITREKFQNTVKQVTNDGVSMCEFNDDYIEHTIDVCNTIAKNLNAVYDFVSSEFTLVIG